MTTKQSLAQDASLNLSPNLQYKWKLTDGFPAQKIESHKTTVMTTFACGGGSSMGYKLAGYDVVAANDIDPQMAKVYKANLNPKQYYLCSITELLARDDLPTVDVLDGSPPCSVFSQVGLREKGWQKEKHFREGQAKQILDDLFFDFIKLAEKMQPKVVIAENVKGMLVGNAKWYTREIVREFNKIDYSCQVFLLNGASMGLPQSRQRVFFIAHKTDKYLKLDFNRKPIPYREIRLDKGTELSQVSQLYKEYYKKSEQGKSVGFFQSVRRQHYDKVPFTITASGQKNFDSYEPRHFYKEELESMGSWPTDYNYCGLAPQYLIGMSVPPLMMAQVAYQVYKQLIESKL